VKRDWDIQADVVVVGFGAAGACAAIEAAESGASVVVLDRFDGGGASALSGGVVYAGGGTAQQAEAGVTDTVDAMEAYLRLEVGDAVSGVTLRRFCEQSPAMLTWLTERGVPFEGSLCPVKTSYPTNRHYLYYSGSELSYADEAAPAPRGHRTKGAGTSGRVLYQRLAAAARDRGVTVLPQTMAAELIADADGTIVGISCTSLRDCPGWVRAAHRLLHRLSRKPYLYAPKIGRLLHRPVAALERRYARPLLARAANGVVISAGGFVNDRRMLRKHAPAYRGGLPLGTPGDDGSGIRLGTDAGAATGHLDRMTIWRFLTPPSALLHGILVDADGRRICDESRYGAAIGEAMITGHGGRAWLLIDRDVLALARAQLAAETLWFQRWQARYLLTFGRLADATLTGVARRAGLDPEGLTATVKEYNAGPPDPLGKPAGLIRPLTSPPYSLIDCSIRPRLAYPAPMLTLGGLAVDETTGQVRRADGSAIAGLYAAGRSAVGICSSSYISGLSLADCVFSGRRAGRSAAFSRVV
jgi:3-oxo-5alpha-steroid 4-dehydrogenase